MTGDRGVANQAPTTTKEGIHAHKQRDGGRSRLPNKSLYGGASLALLVGAWWIVSVVADNPLIMPTPSAVAETILMNFTATDPLGGTGWDHLGLTLQRIAAGFSGSMALGTAIGLLMGRSRISEYSLTPLITIGLTMPAIAWTVLAILWFGLTEFMGFFNLIVVVTPFVTVSVWEGTKAVDVDLTQMATVFGASRSDRVRKIYIPHLSPHLFAAARYGFALCWKIILVVELFGLPGGVGTIIYFWYQQVNMTQVLAWTVTFGLIIVVVENLVVAPVRKRVFRWKPDELGHVTVRAA